MKSCPHCQFEIPADEQDHCPGCGETLSQTGSSDDTQTVDLSEPDQHSSAAECKTLDDAAPESADMTVMLPESMSDRDGHVEDINDAEKTISMSDDLGGDHKDSVPDEVFDDSQTATVCLDEVDANDSDEQQTIQNGPDVDQTQTVMLSASDSSVDDRTVMLADSQSDEAAIARPSDEEQRTIEANWDDDRETAPIATIKGIQDDESSARTEHFEDMSRSVPNRTVSSGGGQAAKISTPEFQLQRVLGEGGMGVVWSAKQTSVDRDVAIKMIKGRASQEPAQREKFLAEAIVTSDLDHPNIVPIYDVGNDSRGSIFYAMKQVSGTPWSEVIRQKSLHENLDILLGVSDAIAFAHSRGIIHRDLKPENVMLGAYGEVLLMDWGLALPTQEFRKKGRLRKSTSMGGTPAYMAPEMASGPIHRITYASDVYLLGAILFEIVTGKPPHSGKSVREALLAAMRNTIRKTDESGELITIAHKAMSTDARDRHESVIEFQSEVRSYLEHAESLSLTSLAEKDLEQAQSSGDYQQFAKAAFAFQQAHELWSGNERAKSGFDKANYAYADRAQSNGDYDLAISLLSDEIETHQKLKTQVLQARLERDQRRRRLAAAKRTMAVMAAIFFVVLTGAFLWIRAERNNAVEQKRIAQSERDRATEQEGIAVKERDRANEQKQIAIDAKEELQVAHDNVKEQRQIAIDERDRANEQKQIAIAKEQEAIAAKKAEEYEAYIARIGLAAAKVQENAFDVALKLLNECPPEQRHWEWGRLKHLCEQVSTEFQADGPVDSVSLSPDGKLILATSWDHKARVWDLLSKELVHEFAQDGLYTHAGCWSPDQSFIALAASDLKSQIRIVEVESGKTIGVINGHDDSVVDVKFSPDGNQLISCSYDETAKLWDVSTPSQPKEIATLKGHSWWVWAAAFSPDFDLTNPDQLNQIVTVSQDGNAIVWSIETTDLDSDPMAVRLLNESTSSPVLARQEAVFSEHQGPIFTVDFSPSGDSVATAGHGNSIFIWRPSELPSFDVGNALRGERTQSEFQRWSGHTGAVQSVRYSKAGDLLVSASRDNSVKVWDVEAGQSLKTFRGHFGEVRAVDISSDTKTVVSGSKDGRAIAWNIADYQEIRVLNGRQLTGHSNAILSASFSSDGTEVVTASQDQTSRIWKTSSGELLQTLAEGHQFLASDGIFIHDGKILITSAADDSVRFWDVASGAERFSLNEIGWSATIAVSPDERWLATGSRDQTVKLWDLNKLLGDASFATEGTPDRSIEPAIQLEGHQGRVTSLTFSPVENHLVSCDVNGRCILWNVSSREEIWSVKHHTRRVSDSAYTLDGKEILTASFDNTVGRMDAKTGAEIAEKIFKQGAPVIKLALSPNGQRAVTVSQSVENDKQASELRFWDVASGDLLQSHAPSEFAVSHVCFFPSENRVLAVCDDNSVRVIAVDEDSSTVQIDEKILDFNLIGGTVWSVSFDPSGKSILTLGGSNVRLWDLGSRREKISFRPHSTVADACFSPDGKLIATASWDRSIKIWNRETGQVVSKVIGSDSSLNSIDFHPEGTHLLTASDDATATLWEIESGRMVLSFEGHTDRISDAMFSTSGDQILTVSADRTARVWDAETTKTIQIFEGHEWAILAGGFSPDSTRIVTAGEDNKVRIWDITTGEQIGIGEGHTAAVTSVCFSPDGERIFSASADGSAKVWDATAGHAGTEIVTLTQQPDDFTTITISPDGSQVLTADRDGQAKIWLTSPWRTTE